MIFNNVSFKWIISISSQYLISYRNQSFDLHCKSGFHVKSNTGLDNGIRYWVLIVEKICCEWNWLITETFLLFIRPSLFTFHTAIHSPLSIRLKYSTPTLPYNFCFPTENMQTFVSLFTQFIFYITHSSLDLSKVSGMLIMKKIF